MAQRAIRADVIVRGRLLLSELGGVTAETPDPVDGRVERQDDGAPNSLEIGKYADVVVHDCHPFDPRCRWYRIDLGHSHLRCRAAGLRRGKRVT